MSGAWTPGAFIPVAEWEWHQIQEKVADALALPRTFRKERLESIAAEYGVSVRTLYRWRHKELYPVRVGRYSALFAVGKSLPVQVTGWEDEAA